jgi:hypothetical protein
MEKNEAASKRKTAPPLSVSNIEKERSSILEAREQAPNPALLDDEVRMLLQRLRHHSIPRLEVQKIRQGGSDKSNSRE